MKKLIILCLAAALCSSCGIYKKYSRPEVQTDGLYGEFETTDTTSLGNVDWREIFTDPHLQTLIEQALENNTDFKSAQLNVKASEAALKSARLSYLPSFNLGPQGSISSFDNRYTTKVYNVALTANWQVDIFNKLTNAKRKSKAVYEASKEYRQAVRSQVITGVANLYYTLLMVDAQYEVSKETAEKWEESVNAMKAMKEAGMANEAAVAQYEGTYYSILASTNEIEDKRLQVRNALCTLLAQAPQEIERGTLDEQQMPENITVGVPVQMLSNRPDVRAAEFSLMQAYYATAEARSSLYPSINLSGTLGWTNNGGGAIVNPGKVLLSAVGSVLMPIFNAGANRARVKIMKAQQEQALLSFQQALLNAGAEVNNSMAQYQSAHERTVIHSRQVESLERAVESTKLLMNYGPTTYLEVLTAEQSLLSARLNYIATRFDEIQGVVNLYTALGGGREIENTEK